MSGDTFHSRIGTSNNYGDVVNVQGSGNIGIKKDGNAPLTPAQLESLATLVDLVEELRERVPRADAAVIDANLPAALSRSPGAALEQRRAALLAISGIAATVGTVGPQVVEAINSLLTLFGLG